MGGLAGMLEFIKFMFATAYPFMQYRDSKRERKVLFYLKICFFLSIMASLNFFLTGGEIERSPASDITKLLYEYVPVLNIIPLKFSQFMTTMSLSILIEAFIIFLPILAPIMFLVKDKSRKKERNNTVNNFEKIKEIITVIPERFIDRLHQRVVLDKDIKVIEYPNTNNKRKKPLKLVMDKQERLIGYNCDTEQKNDSEFVHNYDKEDSNYNTDTEIENDLEFVNDKDTQLVLNAIWDNQTKNIAPSNNKVSDITGIGRNEVISIKNRLNKIGILGSEGNKTYVKKDRNEVREELSWIKF